MAKRTADIFSEETHDRVLARIRSRSAADWQRVVEQQPDNLPEDWPSLMKLPDASRRRMNGSADKAPTG